MKTESKFQPVDLAYGQSEDVALITQIVTQVEKAHNQKTPELFAQLFAEDAVFVNAVGVRLSGREQIYQAVKKVMEGFMAKSYARYEVTGIRFIRPDVAIADIKQHPITKDGEPLDGEIRGVPTYVLVKEQGAWTIVSGQNTLVQ